MRLHTLSLLLPLAFTVACRNKVDDDGIRDSPVPADSDPESDDQDGDGYVADTLGGDDCNDADAGVNPGVAEVPYDSVDNDCNAATPDDDLDGDGYLLVTDCNDEDASINPSGEETCDGVDNDCDGLVDNAPDAPIWYADADADGYGDDATSQAACEQPEGYTATGDDCNDLDAAYNPGVVEEDCSDPNDYNCDGSVGYADGDGDGYPACLDCDDSRDTVNAAGVEVCNSLDDDCDGVVDDSATDATTWYQDNDDDGYGQNDSTLTQCDQPESYSNLPGDCDDNASAVNPDATESCSDPNDYNCDGSVGYADADLDGHAACDECNDEDGAVFPGAVEVCNGVDDDCDGTVDGELADGASTWYQDLDADGFGDDTVITIACDQPTGYLPTAGDCDDHDDDIRPDADEVCDGDDNDCDGEIDEEGGTTPYYTDADGDGYGDVSTGAASCEAPAGTVTSGTDCNDADAAYNPAATETCTDTVDYNCDGSIGFTDEDGDGFAACEECDDSRADVSPVALEVCNDLDDDCNGVVDDAAIDAATWFQDADSDGYGSTASTEACDAPSGYTSGAGDCDDTARSVNPSAAEVCDGIDNDCDDDADSDAIDRDTFYADSDADGFGDAASTALSCEAPAGHTADDEDCDDTDAGVNPDAVEVCDGDDNDCDGDVDTDATDAGTFYADGDLDGYGSLVSTTACEQPSGYAGNSEDCDDEEATANPGRTEDCDEIDNDCDGEVDEGVTQSWYLDYDGDGYGDDARSATACEAPTSSYIADGGDCDESDPAIHPGAAEGCDDIDHDCDGDIDNDADGDTWSDIACGGDDCDDANASVYPEVGLGCPLGTTCLDVQDNGYDVGDGTYTIDPDGYATGLDPFDVTCDMTTDGGGWTAIPYADDLEFQQHFSDGDGWRFMGTDFTFALDDAQISAIQGLSTEGYQEYVGLCEHVIHYRYDDGATYEYAFGFRFFDDTETAYGSVSYSPYTITLSQDGCSGNGGEGGAEAEASIFVIESALVPVLNIQCRDCGDSGEMLGSPLTENPAWLR